MSIRRAAFSDDLHSEFYPAAELAAAEGLDGLAVRNAGGRNVLDTPVTEVRQMGQYAADLGLEISYVGSQFGRGLYLSPDPAPAVDLIEAAAERAHALDTQLVRAFGLWVEGHDELVTWHDRPDTEGQLELVCAQLAPYSEAAERAGVTLMFELEGASYMGTVREASLVLDAMSSPAVALCWDVCNGWWSGEDPMVGLDLVHHLPLADIQTKDVLPLPDNPAKPTFERAVTGEGGIPYAVILSEVDSWSIDCWVTAERVHHPLRPEDDVRLQNATLSDIRAVSRIMGRDG